MYFAAWIGLNDRSVEAGTDANSFVWVDGSDSTYRQFATSPESQAYPRATGENMGLCCVSDTGDLLIYIARMGGVIGDVALLYFHISVVNLR